jgi:hypothetical protein
VSPLTVGIDESGKTVREIAVIRRNLRIAEGKHGVARVDYLLGRLIFIGNVGAEIDVNESGYGSARFRDYNPYGEGKLPERAIADKLIYFEIGFARAESFIALDKLGTHRIRHWREITVFLAQKEINYFGFFKLTNVRDHFAPPI